MTEKNKNKKNKKNKEGRVDEMQRVSKETGLWWKQEFTGPAFSQDSLLN